VPGNLSATLQIPVPSLISQNPPPPPWGFLPVRRKKRGGEGEKEKLGWRDWRPPVGESEVAALLDPHVAVHPAGEAA
jgi:hypothetical protein